MYRVVGAATRVEVYDPSKGRFVPPTDDATGADKVRGEVLAAVPATALAAARLRARRQMGTALLTITGAAHHRVVAQVETAELMQTAVMDRRPAAVVAVLDTMAKAFGQAAPARPAKSLSPLLNKSRAPERQQLLHGG